MMLHMYQATCTTGINVVQMFKKHMQPIILYIDIGQSIKRSNLNLTNSHDTITSQILKLLSVF